MKGMWRSVYTEEENSLKSDVFSPRRVRSEGFGRWNRISKDETGSFVRSFSVNEQ